MVSCHDYSSSNWAIFAISKFIAMDRNIVLNVFNEFYENKMGNLPNEICCKGRSMDNEESFR